MHAVVVSQGQRRTPPIELAGQRSLQELVQLLHATTVL